MTFMQRLLTLGATTLAAAAIASPALGQSSAGEAGTSEPDPAVTYCRDSTEHPDEGDVLTANRNPGGRWQKCEPGEADGYRAARVQRQQQEADARQAQDQKFQADIKREQSEADQLEKQARLCQTQPSHAGCNLASSSVMQPKPAAPKPVAFVAAQRERVARHGNPAGVGVRPVADLPEETGLEDAVDVPDVRQFALEADSTDGRGPRNLVWFSFVAMAAIASLGYGLWRVLFIEGR